MHTLTMVLDEMETAAQAAGTPMRFLDWLGGLHDLWHMEPQRDLGFLIFHWHLVSHVRSLQIDTKLGVQPYPLQDFAAGGQFAAAGPMPTPAAQSLDQLGTYSNSVETWHGGAHMAIGNVTGTPMMNPLVNVALTQFWNLHFRINSEFEARLLSYAAANHPTLTSAAAVVQHIEEQHANAVPFI